MDSRGGDIEGQGHQRIGQGGLAPDQAGGACAASGEIGGKGGIGLGPGGGQMAHGDGAGRPGAGGVQFGGDGGKERGHVDGARAGPARRQGGTGPASAAGAVGAAGGMAGVRSRRRRKLRGAASMTTTWLFGSAPSPGRAGWCRSAGSGRCR